MSVFEIRARYSVAAYLEHENKLLWQSIERFLPSRYSGLRALGLGKVGLGSQDLFLRARGLILSTSALSTMSSDAI